MRRDLAILLRLKWRAFQREAYFWLLVAYNPADRSRTNRLYAVYLAVAAAVWLLVVWAYAVEQSAILGLGMPPALRHSLVAAIPHAVLLALGIALVQALRSAPLKLSANDAYYLAASPVSRAALVLVRFLAAALPWMLIGGVAGMWLAMTLAWPRGEAAAGWAGLHALLITPWISLLATAAAWITGNLRYSWQRRRGGLRAAQAGLGVLLGGALLGAGRAWQAIVLGAFTPFHTVGVIGLALLAVAGLLVMSRRVNLIAVTEDSATFARLQALGPFSPTDLVQSIKKQARLAKQGPRGRLPRTPGLPRTLIARAALVTRRGGWGWLSWGLWGVFVAQIGVTLVRLGALGSLQAWTGMLLVLMLYPPRGAIEVFRADMQEAFLRQFIPVHNLALLAWDTAHALPLLWLGAVIAWAVQMPSVPAIVLGGVAFGLLAGLVLLCLAIECVSLRTFPVERLSYQQAVLIGFGLPLLAGLIAESVVVAGLVGGAVVVGYASVIRHSAVRV